MTAQQASIFDLVPVPPQPRCSKPESLEFYLAVLALRRRGHRVYRQSRTRHVIDGKPVRSHRAVMAMAARTKEQKT